MIYSPPYPPQLNGQAERMNQMVRQTAYTYIYFYQIVQFLWSRLSHCNMLPTRENPDCKSPMETKFGIISNLSMFRALGCRAYIHIPEVTRSSPFSDKAHKGYFIG